MITANFNELLEESAKIHGHLCAGQVIGVRMAILGLHIIGISEPKGIDRKKLLVFVEIDRCATDAIQSVTGCSLGHRTMKFYDYGKMAATFYNIETSAAVRVVAREEAREIAQTMYPYSKYGYDKYTAQMLAYQTMTTEELFTWANVSVNVKPEDMPGRPLVRVQCSMCGEFVQDNRHITRDARHICKPCFKG
ncbi:MAG: FmdE family protein [Candidatus Magnetoovum sp. WYHC-5]|nr:FmdE family protein [Candidatus Magnetoovum sp. WYHC-5]